MPDLVVEKGGHPVWSMKAFAFERERQCPDTVNRSLWRQAQLNNVCGLFKVTEGFYQVRGFDLSNMTIVEGRSGIIVIDPLVSTECAAAALALYRRHRPDRPVKAVIYTHSHVDHFGGVGGILTEQQVRAGVPIIAPQGFLKHAASENVYVGAAMGRRAQYMYGPFLPKGPRGQVDSGLGKTQSTGTISLIPPTHEVVRNGPIPGLEDIDRVRIEFQLTPGTEAPAEMNFYFPDHRVLCAAENLTHNLHNILSLRGAQVRDALGWSRYLDETLTFYGDRTEVLFAQHHWPTWSPAKVVGILSKQRDLYRYLHDQTLRLMNKGYTGIEIAEMIERPESLSLPWHCRGYYGTVSHDVKAIYQRYMGWYDAHPAHLWSHPPATSAGRYVELMGGAGNVLKAAGDAYLRRGPSTGRLRTVRGSTLPVAGRVPSSPWNGLPDGPGFCCFPPSWQAAALRPSRMLEILEVPTADTTRDVRPGCSPATAGVSMSRASLPTAAAAA